MLDWKSKAGNFAGAGKYLVLQGRAPSGYRSAMAKRRAPKRAKKQLGRESLESFRAFLGPVAARYSDPQLIQLRSEMRAAARLLLDLYLQKKNSPGTPGAQSF